MIGDMETSFLGFPGGASGKPVNARDLRDADSIPGSVLNWLIPWRRAWQALQYSCLDNPMNTHKSYLYVLYSNQAVFSLFSELVIFILLP